MIPEELVSTAAEVIASAKSLVALTGAGVSAESGIPTFRGRDGLWRRYKPEELATPEAFERDPRLVWEWYKWRMEIVFKARPNPAHEALAELERLGVLKCIITQNVDGLHQRAGSKCVIELHGSLWRVRCTTCGYKSRVEEPPREILPRCPVCGGLLRPDVVWFGELLPKAAIEHAFRLAMECDVMLVVGTSGVVLPAGLLPVAAKQHGARIVEVNADESAITNIADVFVEAPAGIALPRIVEKVKAILRSG